MIFLRWVPGLGNQTLARRHSSPAMAARFPAEDSPRSRLAFDRLEVPAAALGALEAGSARPGFLRRAVGAIRARRIHPPPLP